MLCSLAIILLHCCIFCLFAKEQITTKTELGWIIGNIIETSSGTGDSPSQIYEFLGIRYGVPPVGDLRFRPSSVNSYSFSDHDSSASQVYDATNYGPACYQQYASNSGIKNMSEDCLFLNVWTPYDMHSHSHSTKKSKTQLLPVMVFIHGGAFVSGAGSESIYASDGIASRGKNVVAVTINYRLGALGFFASEELYEENMKYDNFASYGGLNGIYDQIIAINWVKKYISSFGGNSDDITIYGESAGALSTCVLYFSPLLRDGIINKVIMESGPCTGPWGPFSLDYGLLYCDDACTNGNVPII